MDLPIERTGLYDLDSCSAQHSGALAALRLLNSYNQLLTPPVLSGSICEADIRRRGEKRPIPQELKDEKYFERRRRNNQAAKKSRDARRIREDQIAWRACLLEQENASLRAHISALRQEALTLRALLASRAEPPPAQPTPSSTTD
ncbi:transcription factor ces-2-like [Amyelois transitella]|uniref:transcription factor ces-2-like n=1 Tax=Amyelois transitella TaxID=680683 RepID=UPI0029907ABB|nr:transcription factor ces-2-like [Amyelois transitella]